MENMLKLQSGRIKDGLSTGARGRNVGSILKCTKKAYDFRSLVVLACTESSLPGKTRDMRSHKKFFPVTFCQGPECHKTF